MKTRRATLSTLAALTVVSATAALGFDRVFRDGAYVAPLLLAALAPHVIGRLVRRHTDLALPAIVASFVALAALVTWYTAWGTTFLGVPTAATPDAVGQVLADGWQVLRTGVAPVPASTGAVALATIAVWVMATAADTAVFSAEVSIGGLVPSLVIVVVSSSLGPDDISLFTVAPYLAAALWFLVSRHHDLAARGRSWFSVSGPQRPDGTTAAAARLGALAVAIGLILTPLLPGATGGPFLDYRRGGGPGGYQAGQNPLVDIKARLTQLVDTELFTVASPERLYWRQVALDQFDGTEWTISATTRAATEVLDGAGDAPTVEQEFTLTGLYERWLPAAYEPVAIDLDGTRVVPESRTLVNVDDEVVGLTYRVESLLRPDTPTAAEIARTARELPVVLRPYTELPDDLPSVVGDTARAITATAATPYDKARALELFFTDGSFTYDLDVAPTSGSNAITAFLADRHGFCQQFAGTFGAMARALGLPTRIAVGFTPGELDPERGVYRVTGRNAHSWPEVWLAGLGWTAFEPTPAGNQPGAADPTPDSESASDPSSPATPTTTRAPVPPPTATPPAPADGGDAAVAAPTGPNADSTRVGWILAIAGGVAVVIFVGWKLAGVIVDRRRRRFLRGGPRRAAAIGAWREVVDHLAVRGVAVTPAQTPREVLALLDAEAGADVDGVINPELASAIRRPLETMAATATDALWAGSEPGERSVEEIWADLELVEEALAATTRRPVRLWRAFFGVAGMSQPAR